MLGLVACGDPTEPEFPGSWALFGLEGDTVLVLEAFGTAIYAGTSSGIYRLDSANPVGDWSPIGLRNRRVKGLAVLSPDTIVAAVHITGMPPDTVSLYRTVDGGAHWQPSQNGFGAGDGSNLVQDLEVVRESTILATGGSAVVARSSSSGEAWRKVWGDWSGGALSTFAEATPAWPDLVWGGGESGYFQPFLLKSSDGADSWSEIWLDVGGDNAHYSVAVAPDDSARAWTGMEGRILATTDGGANWRPVLAPASYPYFFAIEISKRDPRRLYAAGAINTPEPQPLTLYVSPDRGRSWSTVTNEDVDHGGAHDMLVLSDGAAELVIVGTDQGCYAYRVTAH